MTVQPFNPLSKLIREGRIPQDFSGWVAELSNGEITREAVYTATHGELTDWQALIDRLARENLRIVQMFLRRGNVAVATVRNAEGYFHAYQQQTSINSEFAQTLQGVGTVHGDAIVIQWVGARGDVFQDMSHLNTLLPHTTLRVVNDLYKPN